MTKLFAGTGRIFGADVLAASVWWKLFISRDRHDHTSRRMGSLAGQFHGDDLGSGEKPATTRCLAVKADLQYPRGKLLLPQSGE